MNWKEVVLFLIAVLSGLVFGFVAIERCWNQPYNFALLLRMPWWAWLLWVVSVVSYIFLKRSLEKK